MLTLGDEIIIWLLAFSAACAAGTLNRIDGADDSPCQCTCEEPR